MSEPHDPCADLAAALAASEEPGALLPAELPCPPLDLLVALHSEVTRTMLSDLAHAGRAAKATWAVVERFPDDPLLRAQAHWTQGTAILYVPNYVSSLEHYDQALTWYERAREQLAPAEPARDVRVVHVVRVFCLSELGRYKEAQEVAELAEEWLKDNPNDYAQLTLLLNRSQLVGRMSNYVQMANLADATIKLAMEINDSGRIAHGWINRAHACIFLGRFTEAEIALEQALDLVKITEEELTIGRALLNRAYLMQCRGQLFAGLTTLREAQQKLHQAYGELADCSVVEASIYEQLKQLPEAQKAAYFASEQFAKQCMPVYSAGSALQAVRVAVQQRLTGAASKLLDFAAEQAQQADIPLLNAILTISKALIATLPTSHSSLKADLQEQRVTRTNVQQAIYFLQLNGLVREATEGHLAAAALDVQLGNVSDAIIRYRALIQYQDRQIQLIANNELGELLTPLDGLSYFQRATELAVEQRRALPMEELQARYSSETSPYHLRLAACHMALNEVIQAFNVICEAKAGPLLDLRAVSGSLSKSAREWLETTKSDITRWRIQEQDHLRTALQAEQQNQRERVEYHRQKAQEAARELQAAEQRLTAALRTEGGRDGQAQVPSSADIQSTLQQGVALLEYAQLGDDLGCFLVQPDAPIIYHVLGRYDAIAPLLDRWSLVCRRMMSTTSPSASRQVQAALAPLYALLLGPLRSELADVEHLLIAPFGILHHVPWATLWDGEAALADRYTLTLTPCGALWAAPMEGRKDGDAEFPVVAPPRLLGAAGSGERYLTHVAGELAAIRRHLPNAEVYPEATAENLRAEPAPHILHIAAHGRTNPSAPLCSTIELSDGPFMLLEAHRLNLRGTKLVALSACETSVRPDYGDMVLALAGAFLCAGAEAVLASLWAVSDAATATLMDQFYAALAAGHSPAAALRQAQHHIRPDHPLDWAAFQLWAGTADRGQGSGVRSQGEEHMMLNNITNAPQTR
jgi:CHAT domain-containing protein/tetratricopeptide (TPR) repeat protein